MTEEENRKGFLKYLQPTALVIFLIVLPLGSWYYLQRGLDYRLDALEELKTHGEIPSFELVTADDSLLTKSEIQGKLTVAAFLSNRDKEKSATYGKVLSKLLNQFGEGNGFRLLVHGLDTAVDNASAMMAFAERYELLDEEVCYFLPAVQPGMKDLALEGYLLPIGGDNAALMQNTYLVLADSSLTIRNFYDVTDEKQVKRLVEHIAMTIPRAPERDVVFKREKEK